MPQSLSATDVRDRLAELSATSWTYTAIGVAVELGLPAHLTEPTDAAALAAAAGIPVALARSLAEVLVAGLADRIEIRADRIEALDAREQFDLVWMPGNFLGPELVPAALAAVHRALRPGGYVLNASFGGGGDDHRSVAARLRSVLWGGDVVEPERMVGWLSEAGFTDVVLMPRLPSGLVPMQARRP